MSALVRQMLENSELARENFILRASNNDIESKNAAMKAEIAALKKSMGKREITQSSIATLSLNTPQPAEAALSNSYAMSPDELQSEAPMLPAKQEPPALIAPEPQEGMDKHERARIVEQLYGAAYEGNLEELERLLSTDKGRACINEGDENGGMTPLHWAANMSKLEAVRLLVERGAEVDSLCLGGTPLTRAAQYGYDSIAEHLLSKGASKEKAIKNAPDEILVENFFFEYERVIQNRQEFKMKREELNATMMSSKEPETLPTSCKGITIGGLKRMKAQMQSECEAGRFKEDKSFPDGTNCKGTMKYEDLTTTDIVYRYVKDESVTGNLRLIDTGLVAPDNKNMPTFFISHAWKGRFSVLLEEIFAYVEKHGISDDTAFWIDVFSVNQHGSKECSEFSQAQNQADVQAFNNVVQTCIDGTLVVCDFEMCETYSRAWCLFEWDWTMYYHGREKLQFLGLSKDQAESGKDKIDVEMARCFKAEDKEMILMEIREKHGSTQVFNNKLYNKWIDIQYGLN